MAFYSDKKFAGTWKTFFYFSFNFFNTFMLKRKHDTWWQIIIANKEQNKLKDDPCGTPFKKVTMSRNFFSKFGSNKRLIGNISISWKHTLKDQYLTINYQSCEMSYGYFWRVKLIFIKLLFNNINKLFKLYQR